MTFLPLLHKVIFCVSDLYLLKLFVIGAYLSVSVLVLIRAVSEAKQVIHLTESYDRSAGHVVVASGKMAKTNQHNQLDSPDED
jgi:hypothetical protein